MRELPRPWEAETDPAVREALAQRAITEAAELAHSSGWKSVVSALDEEISALLEALARSAKEDEQNRGAIRALRHVRSMPENLIRAASAELTKHRGT